MEPDPSDQAVKLDAELLAVPLAHESKTSIKEEFSLIKKEPRQIWLLFCLFFAYTGVIDLPI